MKKLLEERHDLLAGVFAALALVSIICEIALSGFSAESLAGGIKDMSGILIDVMVLLVAASVLIRKPVNFREKFNDAMEGVKIKYDPLLVEDKVEKVIRYNIASNPDAIFTGKAKAPERIFELNKEDPSDIKFYINKSFFDRVAGTEYDAEKIASQIALRIQTVYKDYGVKTFPNGNNYGIQVDFNRALNTIEDIDELISLIDYTLLLFVARNKS